MSSIQPADNDLAAELILNKMMNGQIKSASGRTVTSGNRMLAQELNATAYETGVSAASVKGAEGYVVAAQTQTSAMIDKLKEMRTLLTAASSGTDEQAVAAGLQAQTLMNEITALVGTEINDVKLFDAAKSVNAGLDTTISTLGLKPSFAAAYGAGTQNMGLLQMDTTGVITSTDGTAAKVTTAALAKTALGTIDEAIEGLTNNLSLYTQQFQALDSRATILNDLGGSFTASANAQTTNAANGSTGLLNSVLGTTTA